MWDSGNPNARAAAEEHEQETRQDHPDKGEDHDERADDQNDMDDQFPAGTVIHFPFRRGMNGCCHFHPPSIVMDELLFGDELKRREDRNDHKGIEHDGGAISFVEFFKGLPVKQGHQHRGVLVGRIPGVDQQVDGIKLLQGGHGPHQHHKEQCRRHHGDGDVEERLDSVCPVDLRRFIVAF